ncbi:MAG TPA: hypothetical protein VMW69_14840, partial [Spirochaetia bacterium]|nr:hypothetical protein [Spirochaetia bacterium]
LSGELATDACPHTMDEWFLPGTEPGFCTWHVAGPGGLETHYPQLYQSWLASYRYKSPTSFLDSPVELLAPLDGSVYYWEPGLPPGTQAVHIRSIGRGVGTLRVDGELIAQGSFPLNADWPLQIGAHTLSLTADNGSQEIAFEVR